MHRNNPVWLLVCTEVQLYIVMVVEKWLKQQVGSYILLNVQTLWRGSVWLVDILSEQELLLIFFIFQFGSESSCYCWTCNKQTLGKFWYLLIPHSCLKSFNMFAGYCRKVLWSRLQDQLPGGKSLPAGSCYKPPLAAYRWHVSPAAEEICSIATAILTLCCSLLVDAWEPVLTLLLLAAPPLAQQHRKGVVRAVISSGNLLNSCLYRCLWQQLLSLLLSLCHLVTFEHPL